MCVCVCKLIIMIFYLALLAIYFLDSLLSSVVRFKLGAVLYTNIIFPDVDECTLGTHDCDDVNSYCSDTKESFICVCKEGFSDNGFGCSGNLFSKLNLIV